MTSELVTMLRRLSEWQAPEGIGILSAYLDSRAEASGERPAARTASTFLRDRLRDLDRLVPQRGPARDSFDQDRAAVEEAFENADPAAAGIAVFSCSASAHFESLAVGKPFRNQVMYQPAAALFPLARLADEFEPAVVALADTNTLRVFSVRLGFIEETASKDEDSVNFQKRQTGGFSQARYQRHIEKHRRDFADEAAKVIQQVMDEDEATRLILAGDEVAIPLLLEALPQHVRDKVVGEPLRIHIRAPRDEVAAEVSLLLDEVEAEDSRAAADVLIGEFLEDDLGVVGEAGTRKALEQGSADTLVMLKSFEPVETREELVRLAVQTAARVESVPEHEGLAQLGGVGAILRYRSW